MVEVPTGYGTHYASDLDPRPLHSLLDATCPVSPMHIDIVRADRAQTGSDAPRLVLRAVAGEHFLQRADELGGGEGGGVPHREHSLVEDIARLVDHWSDLPLGLALSSTVIPTCDMRGLLTSCSQHR